MKRMTMGLIIGLSFVLVQADALAFPSNRNLGERNAALSVKGFMFPGGILPNKAGKPSGNGLEIRFAQWSGSGFVVKDDGTLVTNYHVATKGLQMIAKFDDGSRYDIKHIKVYDPVNDIAILKLFGNKRFKKVKLGDSNRVQPRDPVMAVGNPGGYGLNVTDGKVSQVVKDDNGNPFVLRHTAPIAPGNSGGSLYKDDKVVGVNVRTWFGTQFHQAIPINIVKQLLVPKYDKPKLLQVVFAPKLDNITKKSRQLATTSNRVAAASGQKIGIWAAPWKFRHLTDYLIVLRFPKGANLDLALLDQKGKLMGLGTSRAQGLEVIALTSQYPKRGRIVVLNPHNQPVNFGLSVHKIAW